MTTRFDSGPRFYQESSTDESQDDWDEWTGDKKRGPILTYVSNFFHVMGILVLGIFILAALFFGISVFWKLVFPMIGK
jgi:hypothetical protein